MASEEEDILDKINRLRSQINQHKSNKQSSAHPPSRAHPYNQPSNWTTPNASANVGYSRGGYSARGASSARGYSRGRGAAPTYRNRTLILNNNNTPVDTTAANVETGGTSTPPTSGQAWISKTDRHMQLINPAIFEKDSQRRAKAIEETRQQKLKQRDEREKHKLSNHLQRFAGKSYVPGPSSDQGNYEVIVQGITFRVVKDGGKLVKAPGDLNAAKSTPKTALIGGVKFHRSTNGNMYRAGIIKAHRRTAGVKRINEPCKVFSTTGTCPKGPRCRYVHDPSKVAVCKEFLQKGSCPSGDTCDLSHELTPERTPACLHFAKGNCSNPNCRYAHVRVSPAALVCRPFALYGFCEKGVTCHEKHIHECPDFSNTGTCSIKGCKLPHRYKASVMRNTTTGDLVVAGESSDISSDEEDEQIDSEDVDSDDLDEEFFRLEDGDGDHPEITAQHDYVQLS